MFPIVKPASLQRPVFFVKVWSTQAIRNLTFSSKYKRHTVLTSAPPVKVTNFPKEVLWIQCLPQARRTTHHAHHFFSSSRDVCHFQHQINQTPLKAFPNETHAFSNNAFKKRQSACGNVISSGQINTCSTTRTFLGRHFHSSSIHPSKNTIELSSSAQNNQESVKISVNNRSLIIPAVWLRDHCRSPKYYNHETQQKNVDLDLLTRNLKIDSVDLTSNGSEFTIAWNDGHVSKFAMDWLLSNYYGDKSDTGTKRIHWDRDSIESQPLPIVSYNDHMTLEAGLAETVGNICKLGFSIVEGCENTEEATEEVVERLSHVQETLYGKMWTFTSDGVRSDTAYSTKALGSHTDTSYLETPAGIQVFHCLKHTGSGGETLLVDGFHCMEILREAYPEDFELLTNTVVPHEYKEKPSNASPGYHMYSLGTTVRIHPASGEFIQLRFNPYDRAPLNTVSALEIPPFYRAYGRLYNIISDPSGQFWHKLKPGQVLFIDNWRVMHGRATFDGTRVMCGCYLPRDEWVSKARIFGVW